MAVLMGGMTLVDTETNTGDPGVYLDRITSMATTVIGGTTYLYAASLNESAIEIFTVGSDGTLTSAGELQTNFTSLPGAPRDFDIMTVGSSRYLVVSGGNAAAALFTYQIDVTAGPTQGSLTVVDREEAVGIVGVNQVAATAGGNSFIVSVNDGKMTCLQIAADGQITLRDTETELATPALPLSGAYQVTSFIRNGVTYIATSGRIEFGVLGNSDGIGLWRLNANGTLDHQDTEPALTPNGFSAIHSAVIGGRQFVFAANEASPNNQKSIVTYEMTAAGTLTLVSEFLNVAYRLQNMTHFTVDGLTFLAMSSWGEGTSTGDGLMIYGVDGNGTVNFVGAQNTLSPTLQNSLTHALFQTPDRVFGLSSAWPQPGFGGFNAGINSFDLGGGNDVITGTATADQIIGLLGNDTINAGGGDDVAYGGGDKDNLSGEAGNDTLEGAIGTDSLSGGSGNDSLLGGANADTLAGGTENDTLMGGGGDDSLRGEGGGDSISGDPGRDTLSGGTGVDSLYGGTENDVLFGDEEGDSLWGDDGADEMSGGLGNDVLAGGQGADVLNGGDNADILYGGTENDALFGDAQDDSLWGDDGNDVLTGGLGNDSLTGDQGVDVLYGNDGNDTLFGGTENDQLSGGIGNDSLGGNQGADELMGNEGADTLNGAAESDGLFGGAQNDQLYGGDGNDSLEGFTGDDTLDGGTGNDTLTGGDGVSVIYGGDGNDEIWAHGEFTPIERGSTLPHGSTLTGGAGEDTLNGTLDFDAASYLGSAAVTVFLNSADGTTTGGHATGDVLIGIDGLIGSNAADSLVGNLDDNDLFGQGGADTIRGGAGNDLIVGGRAPLTPFILGGDKGNSLFGEAGADLIKGDVGNDSLSGGDGRDILQDSAGRDTLRGGNDGDTFVFTAGEAGNDVVIDNFAAFAKNRIDLSDFAAFQNLSDVVAAATDLRGSAVITLEAGRTLTIQGETISELFAGMFIFDPN